MQEEKSLISPVLPRLTDMIAVRGEGAYLYDERGNAYLDFTSGIGVTNTGHCHPRVVEAIREQAGNLIHGQANIVYHEPMLQLASELRCILPEKLDGFFFSNSGAEAVEGAIKLARAATGRTNIIVFQGSFHGRTIGTMSLTTSKTIYRAGYQPLMSGVFVAPYPYSYRYGWDEEETSQWCLKELEFLLLSQTAPDETAAFLIEPILGEGGYVVPPISFMKGLRKIADQHGILLILDEIQSGFGRTGKWFGFEHFDIQPEILTIAKGLAAGMPISSVISSLDIMKKWKPGSHGGTYGGNAISSSAAIATIQVIRDEKLLDNAKERGAQLQKGLRNLQEKHSVIGDIRGVGLMIGIEFRTENHKPSQKIAKAFQKKCQENELLLLTCGPWENTVRLIPPLIITSEQVQFVLGVFQNVLEKIDVS